MNIKLKNKLIFVYTTLILILIAIIVLSSSYIFRNNFNDYVINNREKEIQKILDQVTEVLKADNDPASTYDELYKIGLDALDKGLILMVNTDYRHQLICISDIFPKESNEMLYHMQATLDSVYPYFKGDYQEKIFPLEEDGVRYGYVTLGYYGPIYYSDFDALFLKAVKNAIYLIGFIFFIVSSIVVYFLAGKLSAPIYEVSKKAEDIGDGKYNELININSSTIEIQNLINSINYLAKSLETQQQIKKQLAINYTHEIRTPITCVLTSLEGMLDGVFEITPERLESLYVEIKRISNMVEDVDKLVEVSDATLTLDKNNIDIADLIEKCILSFESVAKNKDISISYEKKTMNNYIIEVDEEKIKSVIINLISNAIKYTDKDGNVIVNLELKKEECYIKVKDNGIGIEKEEQSMIFEHLYRVEQSRVKEVEGFGVGLAISKNIVLAHNGSIKVNSELGEGSEFLVRIPRP